MADYDFPPLLQGEGPSLDAASILQAQGAANWARTFGEHGAGKNNLMTRKRHNADIANETAVMQQAQAEKQRADILTSKTHQDFYFRSKKLDMDRVNAEATLKLREQTFNHKEQMLPAELEAKQAATNAALAREKATTASATMKARLQERKDADTIGFAQEMQKINAVPGTPEFARATIETRLKYPAMDSSVYDDAWKATGSELEPAEALKRFEAARTAAPNATVTARIGGGVTVTDRPKDTAKLQQRLDRLVLERTKTNLDENQKKLLDEIIEDAKAQLGGGGFANSVIKEAPAAAPVRERIATNPATGAKMVFRNGAWQPLTQ